jgi:hypothetical protein
MRYAAPIAYFAMAAFCFYLSTGENFYGGGVGRKAVNNPVPKWFGRFWFVGCGLACAYLGVHALK